MLFSQHGDLRQMSRKINKTKNKIFGKKRRSAAGAAIQQVYVPPEADPWEEVSTASGLDLLTQEPDIVSGFESVLTAGAAYYLGSSGQPTTVDTESGFLGIAVDDSTIKMTSKKFSQLKVDKLVLGTVEFEPNENKELVMKNQSGELMVLKPNGDVIFKGS